MVLSASSICACQELSVVSSQPDHCFVTAPQAAKGKKAVLDFFVQMLGVPAASWQPSPGHPAVPPWLESIGKLLSDRDTEVRRSAGNALEHYFKNVDSHPVLVYITASDASQQTAAKKALAKAVPDINAQLLAFQRREGFR
jgi:hypothetical protein